MYWRKLYVSTGERPVENAITFKNPVKGLKKLVSKIFK